MTCLEMDTDLFIEGAIYYYENKTHSKKDYNNPSINKDFISSRPVYVLKNRETPFEQFTINVLLITSSTHRVGIPINITGFKNGKVLPYAVHSVHRENLVKFMGVASDHIIQEVNEAIAYHSFATDKKPKYLTDYEHALEEEQEKLNNMSMKEKSVYLFLKDRCVYNQNYMASFDEIFKAYRKYSGDGGYSRTQDFSRVLNKHISAFELVDIKTENKVKMIYGLSLNGNVHKINPQPEDDHKKGVITESTKAYELTSESDELFKMLSEKGREVYLKLDIVQKIELYEVDMDKYDLPGNVSREDKEIIKKISSIDVDKRKTTVLANLKNGTSPLTMNAIDQYVLYICSNSDIRNNIKPYYLKSGGLTRLKKELRKNIKHFFKKIK